MKRDCVSNTIVGLCYDIATWHDICAAMYEHEELIPWAEKLLDDIGGEICICPKNIRKDELYIVQSCDTCEHRGNCYVSIMPPVCKDYKRK